MPASRGLSYPVTRVAVTHDRWRMSGFDRRDEGCAMYPEDDQVYLEGFEPPQQSLFAATDADEPGDQDEGTVFAELLEPFESWLPGLFSWWVGGTEEEWARAAWEALGRRGLLNTAEEGAEFTVLLDNAALLVTLSAINNRFQGIRDGDWEGSQWQWAHPDVDQRDLGVSDMQIGRWAERRALGIEEDADETLAMVLKEAAYDLAGDVLEALEGEWGENGSFSSLWITSHDDATHPATPEVVFEVMNYPTNDMLAVYQWFTTDRDI